MNQNFEPQIIIKISDLYLEFYKEIRKWSKPERYNLGCRCEILIIEVLEKTFKASRNYNKLQNLKKANIKLQVLKILIRTAKNIQIMPFRKYQFFQEKILEIGRMIGGWIKTVQTIRQNAPHFQDCD